MDALKAKVLKELIDVLDQEDGKMLMKHPKVIAAKVTMAKPMDAKMAEKMKEEMPEAPETEMEGEEEDGLGDVLEDVTELEDMPEEMKAKLLKMLTK